MGSLPENNGKIAIVTGAAVMHLMTVSRTQTYLIFRAVSGLFLLPIYMSAATASLCVVDGRKKDKRSLTLLMHPEIQRYSSNAMSLHLLHNLSFSRRSGKSGIVSMS